MNLIICCTPFQVLLAEKIIEKYPDDEFYGLMIFPINSEKYSLYKKRLFSKCSNDLAILNRPNYTHNVIKSLYSLIKLRGALLSLPNFDKVFLANLDNNYFHLLLSSVKFNSLYSFDDGLANIDKTSGFYKTHHLPFFKKLILRLLGNKYDYFALKNMLTEHYTIYSSENIIENTKCLDVFKCADSVIDYSKQELSILLGQPIYEQSYLNKEDIDKKHISLTKQVVNKFDIDYYFPHPREDYIIDGVSYINTNLIFEDYFLQNMESNRRYIIYTYFSGAILPFINLNNVKVISIKPYDLPIERLGSYDLMKSFNINVIEEHVL